MVFLNPLFLWTLLGLSIPLAIHLWSKKKVKTIKIGSTQLLKEQNPKQTSSIRLNQWVLLLLRLIILTLISLLIAGTNFEINRKDKTVTYLVEPSLLNVDKVASILDTIEDDQKRLLDKGFPYIQDVDPISGYENAPNYWQLTQQLQELETDSVVIFTRALFNGFRGMRPQTRIPINWILIDEGITSSQPVEINKKEDQITIVNLQSDANRLTFYKENFTLNKDIFYVDNQEKRLAKGSNKDIIPLAIRESQSKDVLLIFEEAYSAEKYYISSAFRALSAYLNIEIKIHSVKDIKGVDLASFDALIWLKNQPVVPFEGCVLDFQLDEFATGLINPADKSDRYFLTSNLNAENSVSENLPEQLLVLLGLNDTVQKTIHNLDRRAMSFDEIVTNEIYDNGLKNSKSHKDITSWLWAFLLLVLPIERVLSKIKKQ